MVERLFVYGTLAPNSPNKHILKKIGGSWQEATVKGRLKTQKKGWGAKMGYDGIELFLGSDVEYPLFYIKIFPLNKLFLQVQKLKTSAFL